MRYTDVAAHSHTGARWLAILLGASLLVSTFIDNVLLPLIFLLWLISLPGGFGHVARRVRDNPVALSALGLFLVLAAGTVYGPAPPSQAFGTLVKYVDLMVLPVFAALFAARLDRGRGLLCFTVAIIFSLAVSYAGQAGLLIGDPLLPRNPEHPSGFKLSITHSVVMALGAFLFGLLARESARAGERIAYAVLALLSAHNVLFVVISRTGYLVLAALIVYFVITNVRGRKGVLLAALAAAIVATAAYTSSPSFRDRVLEAAVEFSEWRPGSMAETSVGLRLDWYRTSLEIIADHPMTGVGTGGFPQAYAERARGPSPFEVRNPHNEYLLIAVQTGLLGLALLLNLFWQQWRLAPRLVTPLETHLARGLVLTIAIGSLFNSLLLDHTEGLLYAWLTGLLYGGLQSSRKQQTVNG